MTSAGSGANVRGDINVTPLIDVLLVLLIVFLVVMPMMMKLETLQVPRKLVDGNLDGPPPLTLHVRADLSMVLDDGKRAEPITAAAAPRDLRLALEMRPPNAAPVVFVDFADAVPWDAVVSTMDTVRGIAADPDHDGILVALKLREPAE